MRVFRITGLPLLALLLTAPALAQTNDTTNEKKIKDSQAFNFLEGTWTTVKDGLSLTSQWTPIMNGTAWQETSIVDDGNRVGSTAILQYNARSQQWTQTWFNNVGARSTFVGAVADDGRILLEQVAYNGRDIDPPASRIVFIPGDGIYTLDWQSRGEDGTWKPRPEPFVHERVERPGPPAAPGRIAFISKRTGDWEIFTMLPDGSDVQNVTAHPGGDHFPNWIAGGSRIAFRSQRSRDDGAWDRWEVNLDGTDARHVPMPQRLNNPDVGMFPELHPSGSYLVNAAERDGEQDIYVWRFDGGGERVVAPAEGLDYRPLFSPDGSRILFISERDGDAEIYSVAFDGSDLQRLTQSSGNDRYARWSPDGTQIAFASDRDGDLEIFVMNADGSDVRQITENTVEDGEVTWSPDGRYLAFRCDEFGNTEVCTVNLASGEIVNLTKNDSYDAEPTWSPGW